MSDDFLLFTHYIVIFLSIVTTAQPKRRYIRRLGHVLVGHRKKNNKENRQLIPLDSSSDSGEVKNKRII